jgi:hypothetical protein
MRSADFIGQCLSSGAKRKTCAHSEFFGFRPRLCENSDVELARRKFVSITLNNKRTALAVAVERRKERKQFCAFSARARFHTAWTLSRLSPQASAPDSGHSSKLAVLSHVGHGRLPGTQSRDADAYDQEFGPPVGLRSRCPSSGRGQPENRTRTTPSKWST